MKFFKKKEEDVPAEKEETALDVEEVALEETTEEQPVAAEETVQTESAAENVQETQPEPVADAAAEPVAETPAEESVPAEEPAAEKAEPMTAEEALIASAQESDDLYRPTKKQKKARGKKKKTEAQEIGPAEDTVITRSDEEAHRNVRYNIPSVATQTKIAMCVELQRICKTQIFLGTFILGIAMVVIVNIEQVMDYITRFLDMLFNYEIIRYADGPTTYMATMLALLPFLGVFFCASNMSGSLPAEFKERTVYLHFALPVSKKSYYIGKFIADFLPVVALIVVGYGFAYICSDMEFETDISAPFVLFSLIIALAGAFALASMIFCASAGKMKGSTIKSLAGIIILIPLLMMVTSILGDQISSLESTMESIQKIIGYLPFGSFDVALYQLDSAGMILSPSAIFDNYEVKNANAVIALVIYIAWGAAFMLRGINKFSRRQL